MQLDPKKFKQDENDPRVFHRIGKIPTIKHGKTPPTDVGRTRDESPMQ